MILNYFVRYRDNLGETFGYEREFIRDSFYVGDSMDSDTLLKMVYAILPKEGNDYMNPTHSKVRVYCIDTETNERVYVAELKWIHNDLMIYHRDGRYGFFN